MAFGSNTETTDVVQRWPYGFQEIQPGGDHFEYLGAFTQELQQIDVFIDELYEQRFLETATSRELEKLAAEVGITRQSGENDDEFRFRTRIRKAVAASDGTADDIEAILTVAFGDSALSSINVTHATGAPVIRFEIQETDLNDIPLSRTQFQDELERAFPAGYGVEVVSADTFRFGQSGQSGLGQGELI